METIVKDLQPFYHWAEFTKKYKKTMFLRKFRYGLFSIFIIVVSTVFFSGDAFA